MGEGGWMGKCVDAVEKFWSTEQGVFMSLQW